MTLFDDEPGEVMLMNDNDKKRQVFERCMQKEKSVCNPIINWTTGELWEYIESEKIQINELYGCGFDRVGCIGCPMADKKRNFQFGVFPKYRLMYIHAFERMLEELRKAAPGEELRWKDGLEVFEWWMEEDGIKGQMEIEDLLDNSY